MEDGLKIGELARKAGVTAKAIRFYERKRILPPAKRAVNGYRLYGDDAVEMLRFVKQATGLGLTLAETKDIITMLRICNQMMAQMGGIEGMTPQAKTQAPAPSEPTEHGTKQAGALEVTLVSAPPLSAEAMQRMMPAMSGGMQGMGGMQGGMGSMMGGKGMGGMMSGQGQGAPTHWIGVIVRDLKDDRAVQDLDITLTARKGGLARTAKLMSMPGSYGANISLPEKGRYTVTVTIARPAQPVSVAFPFDHE